MKKAILYFILILLSIFVFGPDGIAQAEDEDDDNFCNELAAIIDTGELSIDSLKGAEFVDKDPSLGEFYWSECTFNFTRMRSCYITESFDQKFWVATYILSTTNTKEEAQTLTAELDKLVEKCLGSNWTKITEGQAGMYYKGEAKKGKFKETALEVNYGFALDLFEVYLNISFPKKKVK